MHLVVLGNTRTIAACESSNNVFVTLYDLPAAEGTAVNLIGLKRSGFNFSISYKQSFNDLREISELVLYLLNRGDVFIFCLFSL